MSHRTTTTLPIKGTTVSIDNFQTDLMLPRIDDSVNSKHSEVIAPYTDGGPSSSMTFVNVLKTKMGGGLASTSYGPPDFVPPPEGSPMWFTMAFQIIFRKDMWAKIKRLELDDRIMLKDSVKDWPTDAEIKAGKKLPLRHINESHQFNQDTGEWEYDPTGDGWEGIGFKPKIPMLTSSNGLTNVNDIRFLWYWNGKLEDQGLWSSISMQQNGEVYSLPAHFQNRKLLPLRWAGPLRHPQIQTEGDYIPDNLGYDWHAFSIVRAAMRHSTEPLSLSDAWPRQ